MFKVWSVYYQLKKNWGVGLKSGSLLRLQDPRGQFGYADLCPWPEFGDPALEQQFSSLSGPSLKPLIRRSLQIAHQDLKLRSAQQKWLNTELATNFTHNYLVPETDIKKLPDLHKAISQGFEVFKIKVGLNPIEEAHFLNQMSALFPHIRLRLDANLRFDRVNLETFWQSLEPRTQACIEYFEDPAPFNLDLWRSLSEKVTLACDFALELKDLEKHLKNQQSNPMGIYVFKPGRNSFDEIAFLKNSGIQIAVTSQMGHALDVAYSTGAALELKAQGWDVNSVLGCLNPGVYSLDAFYSQIEASGPKLLSVPGWGLGFEELLGAQSWCYQGEVREVL